MSQMRVCRWWHERSMFVSDETFVPFALIKLFIDRQVGIANRANHNKANAANRIQFKK